MIKHLYTVLITALLIVSLSSCSIKADEHDTAQYDVKSSAVLMISNKTELDKDAAAELYELVTKSGLTGELKYVTVWTDTETGEPYYRLRTNDGKREVYIADGAVIRITDGDIVYYDASSGSVISDDTTTEAYINDYVTSTPETTASVTTENDVIMESVSETTSEPESTALPATDTENEPITTARETEPEPPQTQPPAAQTYVLNKNTKKFHLPSCDSAKQIKASNREEYNGDREPLIAKGYSPCKRCNP